KTFRLGPKLRYPITISKFIKNKGDDVKKQETILQYTFRFERTVGDPALNEERTVQETGWADWDCPTDGTISQWKVKVGDVIEKDQVLVTIDELCPHDQQYAGLCVLCGKDMKEASWATDTLDTDRATIAMVHDNVALTVSAAQATRAELNLQQRLLEQRKLSLVVDLDQTIIHACIEPTVGEWQTDPSNPNYEAVKDVRSFQLDDGPRGLTSGCWYYIKLRPGLASFLQRMSELFEMHVYTMGTRAYAEQIANIVDPDKKLFGHRVISRDENGSMTEKSLQRLFPVSTNMVVVIDDRADVWPRNRPNLIKVTPYDFFKGIGDINSSFLPKREDIITPAPAVVPIHKNGPESQNPNALDSKMAEHERVLANGGDENVILQLQAEEQERELEKQLKERPLLHLQKKLDKEELEGLDDGLSIETTNQNGSVHSESPSQSRHNLLRDDDQELIHLEKHLSELHRSFYEQYDARREGRRHRSTDIEPETIPDVGSVLERLKSRVLRGCSIVLSGLVPLGIDIHRSEIGLQATSFGANLRTKVSDKVTHLVISSSRPRTHKVRLAARIPKIRIVNQDWLAGSLQQWRKLNERDFAVEVHPADRAGSQEKSRAPPRITIVANGKPVAENSTDDMEDIDADDDSAINTNSSADEEEDGGLDDMDGVLPAELGEDGKSPVDELSKIVWSDVDKELADYLGSEFDSDSEKGSECEYNTDDQSTDTE
ncbi:uncharacterized protein BCR38DRAFT_311501, partial [Pseudomassariella vexata]